MYDYCQVTVDGNFISCSCQVFSISGNRSCCHARLMEDIMKDQKGESIPYLNKEKIQLGIEMANKPVVQLASKSGVDRFCVNSESSSEFVTLFNISKSSRNIVSCHSSICKIAEGSTRNVRHLQKSEILCDHLIAFRDFYLEELAKHNEETLDSDEEVDSYDSGIPSTLPDEKVLQSSLFYINFKVSRSIFPFLIESHKFIKVLLIHIYHFNCFSGEMFLMMLPANGNFALEAQA